MDKGLVLTPLKHSVEFNQLLNALSNHKTPMVLHGLNEAQKSHITYGIQDALKRQICLITFNEIEGRQLFKDLEFYLGDRVLYFPVRDLVFYNIEAVAEEEINHRIRTLEKLSQGGSYVVVVSVEALLLKLPLPSLFQKNRLIFKLGESLQLSELMEKLLLLGYQRTERVEQRGEFSIRGGIIDIFPASAPNPYRIELFDDEVDSIRGFEVESQKSIDKRETVEIYPAVETLIETANIKKAIEKIKGEMNRTLEVLEAEGKVKLKEKISETIEKIENLGYFKGRDTLLPFFEEKFANLTDYLDHDAIIIADEPGRLREKTEGYVEEFRESFKTLLERGEVLPTQGQRIFSYDELLRSLERKSVITLSLLPKNNPDFQPREIVNFVGRSVQSFNGKIDLLVEEIKRLQYKGYKICLVPGTKERALRLLEILKDRGINVRFVVSSEEAFVSGQVVILQGSLHKGFEYVTSKYIQITDFEIYGVHKKQKQKVKRKDAAPIKSFIELQVGDYVVHESHGIGKYIGIEELKVNNVKKDYLKIRYSGEDNLYVPTDQMDLIQKYIGSDDRPPKLNKLGGTEWVKTKAKVKKAIEDMAQDLLKLYAERESSRGYAFQLDTDWQKQFEDLFPYEETPDQLRCIEEVKADMENIRPMDRLLCGDVGYGKTEVAIRGAFKAVMDNKQVAFLVPTTILAQQHYNTLVQRFSGFPVTVEMLSRFKSPHQQKAILEMARTGNVDIVVGTHRLLSKDIVFKDLGLLVVDEEQRFGVKHKEALKQLKKSVDVLTLTATPIPRTLHMAMIGIRDMSVIEDPPEERFPVQTYVMAYNESIIADAIAREIARGGQIYYVYNRVQSIHQVAARLAQMLPEARVGVGHGQMSERQLENLMMDYYQGEYDVLVCTTIIETGLDISNVNTIIIHDADKLGLSQLYQLRGRVGRSNRQAYAYLMYEKDKVLTEVAEKRLKAIKEFTEFGSGFKIAMRDLEIRGAGNLLGSEQHGHMAAIGYDLYVKLLEETIHELKGEVVERYEDTTIELNVNAYISEAYIAHPSQKIEIYKKIASVRNLQDLYAIEEEIEDRYGDIPSSVRNLLNISYIKAIGQQVKVTNILQRENEIKIAFKDSSMLKPENIGDVLHSFGRRVTFHGTTEPFFIYKVLINDQNKLLAELRLLIEKISGLQQGQN